MVLFFPTHSSLSLEDHRRQAGDLICGFVKRISFGRDFEQQLSFFVEVRSNFSNLDQVLIFLVQVGMMLDCYYQGFFVGGDGQIHSSLSCSGLNYKV